VPVVRGGEINISRGEVGRVAALFGIEQAVRIGGFENLLLRSTEPTGRILRLTHGSRRSADLLQAEMEFVGHLASEGVPVVTPVPSSDSRLVEEFSTSNGDRLLVTCFLEAPGRHLGPGEWAGSSIESYGALVGSMHHVAATFEPTMARRPSWTDAVFDGGISASAETDPALHERWSNARSVARSHPAEGDALLIHRDAHAGNLLGTEGGRLTLLDFDDSAYGTRTHDIAIVLFYWLMGAHDEEFTSTVRRFFNRFVAGYERWAMLPADWPDGVDLLLTLREAEIYWLLSTEHTQTTCHLGNTGS